MDTPEAVPSQPRSTLYEMYVEDIEPFRFHSYEDVKAIWWEAHKCSFKTFNVTSTDGTVYAMVTSAVTMVIVNPKD